MQFTDDANPDRLRALIEIIKPSMDNPSIGKIADALHIDRARFRAYLVHKEKSSYRPAPLSVQLSLERWASEVQEQRAILAWLENGYTNVPLASVRAAFPDPIKTDDTLFSGTQLIDVTGFKEWLEINGYKLAENRVQEYDNGLKYAEIVRSDT